MAPATSIQNLPAELHFVILDCLRGDHRSLRACSLTCRQWTDQAQRNMFSVVSLDMKNLASFCFTAVTHPEFVDQVRHLTIQNIDWLPKPPRNLPRPTAVILLRAVDMHTSNPWINAWLEQTRLSVRQLSLRDCVSNDSNEFTAFLRSMPNLKNVDIDRCQLVCKVIPVPFEGHPNLQSLSLAGGEYHEPATFAVVSTLIACPGAYTNLSIVKVRLKSDCLLAFNAFLGVVGVNLRELDLGIRSSSFDGWNAQDFPLTLEKCSKLTLFDLEVKLPPPERVTSHLFYVPLLLNTLPAPMLRRVKFIVRALRAGQVDLNNLDWVCIAQILDHARFASLRRVIVHIVDGFMLRELIKPFVEARMVGLHARDILRCVHESRRTAF